MCNAPQPRQKIPKDGPGPRGVPDCYYTSRVLNSTYRYESFVKKLRQEEEETKKGLETKTQELKDRQRSDFFISCDRRSLINDVARRVDLCMQSYEQDLNTKRDKLKSKLSLEEERDIRKFVVQAQEGAELLWQQKKDRLQYLVQKRKEEHAKKYKETPLSECINLLPSIHKLRAMETADIQLYQMKEKQARKMADAEFDKMWQEVAMKESEALAARMEQDAIERYRRDLECKLYSDDQLRMRRLQQEKNKELLKEEAKRFKALWEEDERKEQQAENLRTQKRLQAASQRKQSIQERQEQKLLKEKEDKLISNTWDSLTNQGLADDRAKEELRRRKEKDLVEANRRLVQLKLEFSQFSNNNEDLINQEARSIQEVVDRKRCQYKKWALKTNKDCREGMVEQIKEHNQKKEELKKKIEEENQYAAELYRQLEELVRYKEIRDAEKRKAHQKNLLDQIEYNKFIKEKSLKEEKEEMEKLKLAAAQHRGSEMLAPPFYSSTVHPFMKTMAGGLQMREKCPCTKHNYCK